MGFMSEAIWKGVVILALPIPIMVYAIWREYKIMKKMCRYANRCRCRDEMWKDGYVQGYYDVLVTLFIVIVLVIISWLIGWFTAPLFFK